MSIYSGFSTRKLEYEYNICVDQILSLLATRTIKNMHGDYQNIQKMVGWLQCVIIYIIEKVDEDKFKKIFKKLFKFLQKMEIHKYLHPKYSETLTQLARVMKLKILDPLKISQKDSKTDIKENVGNQLQQSNNMLVINSSQNGNNNISNIQLINSTTRCSSVTRGGLVMNSQQRPMSMEMRSRASFNKRNLQLGQQGMQPLKENIKYANQHQILINNVINVNKNEQDSHQSYQSKYYQPPHTAINQKQRNINVVSEEKSQVNTSHGEFLNKNKEEDLFTLSQVTKKNTLGGEEDKENLAATLKRQSNTQNKQDQSNSQFKATEKQRCKTPPSQPTQNQDNQLFTLQQQNNADKYKPEKNGQQTNYNENMDQGVKLSSRGKKGKGLRQNLDYLNLRRESQTQVIPQNLRIEVSVQNTPNTVITGGEFSQKNNQFSHQIRKRSSKQIRTQSKLPFSNQQNKKESDSSKSLHIYESSPGKQDIGYNSFYVETSSIKNLKKNLIQQQNRQQNSSSAKKYAHNQIPTKNNLQEISILDPSTQNNSDAQNIQFNEMYKQPFSSKNKPYHFSPNTTNKKFTLQNIKNGDSNDSSHNSTLQQNNLDELLKNQFFSSQQSSKEQTINNDSSFKEFLFNSQKNEISETQFRNRMIAQNLNVLKGDIDKQHAHTRSQSLLLQQSNHLLDNSISGLSKLTPQNNMMKSRGQEDNPEPQIIQPTHLLPLYTAYSKQSNNVQSPRFENDTFGLTDNQLSLTPIKQLVKRKKSKKKSARQQNEKKSSHSFIINTPKITSINPNKYTYNISPKTIQQVHQ